MADPWIATCRVRALSEDRRRWEGDTDTGEGLLIMLANDPASYEAGIKRAIEAKGYTLESVIGVSPLAASPAYVQHRTEIDQSYWQITEKGLLLINGFHPVMPESPCFETTWNRLLAPGADPLWAVVDAVNWPEAVGLLESRSDATCLYATPDPTAKASAPWLVRLTHDSPITALMKARPHDAHSGILFQSKWAMEELRKHLRKFTMVWTPADKNAPIYFRFYDPRVLLDMMTALDAHNLDCFAAPFTHLAATLSPLCILPKGTKIDAPFDLFDDVSEFQSRLIGSDCGVETRPTSKFSLSQSEFDRFGALQVEKSKHRMARQLFEKMGHNYDKAACLKAAQEAPGIGAKYGLKSRKQVYLIARCLLIVGPSFPEKHPDAIAIMADQNRLAWQRKDTLQNWLIRTGVDVGKQAQSA